MTTVNYSIINAEDPFDKGVGYVIRRNEDGALCGYGEGKNMAARWWRTEREALKFLGEHVIARVSKGATLVTPVVWKLPEDTPSKRAANMFASLTGRTHGSDVTQGAPDDWRDVTADEFQPVPFLDRLLECLDDYGPHSGHEKLGLCFYLNAEFSGDSFDACSFMERARKAGLWRILYPRSQNVPGLFMSEKGGFTTERRRAATRIAQALRTGMLDLCRDDFF